MDDLTPSLPTKPDELPQVAMCFGTDCLHGPSIRSLSFESEMQGNVVVSSAGATVAPPADFRWDYHAPTTLNGPESLQHSGFCAAANSIEGTVKFDFRDIFDDLYSTSVLSIEFFGMSPKEHIFWLATLATEGRPAEVEGLALDRDQRPFLYAVPLRGLSLEGEVTMLAGADFGVGLGPEDTVFQPILAGSKVAETHSAWSEDVPKAWGVVFAHDMLEAESLALTRARFTVDLLNLALTTGCSHFDTRYESELLEWDRTVGNSHITLEPWLMLREVREVKGWIKAIPLIERRSEVKLEQGFDRVKFFLERFALAMRVGDVTDQNQKRILTTRERRLAEGIRRSARWLEIARGEETETDRLIAIWVALEAIVNSVEYPGVFKGSRVELKEALRNAIDGIELLKHQEGELSVDTAFIKGRVFREEWPLRTKLKLFGRSFGITIEEKDVQVVGKAARGRSAVLHGLRDETEIDKEEVRRMTLLTERLIIGASIFGYEDVDSADEEDLEFREVDPAGGAAPLYVNGEEMPYTLTIKQAPDQPQVAEIIAGGKIHGLDRVRWAQPGGEVG